MNPYLIIGLIVAWLVSLATVGYWQNAAGHTAERVIWQARDNEELTKANADIKRLEEAARATEQAHTAALGKIAEDHQKEITDAAAQKERDVAAARAGRIVLRIPAACPRPNGGGAPKVAAAPSLGDGGATAELPRQVVADLLSLADDADAVTRQLGECQAVVRADRTP